MPGDKLTAEDATRWLVENYRHEVYKYARFMLGSVAEAEDATQEIFTRVFQHWGGFQQHSQARTWMWSITRNHVADLLRRRKRESRVIDRSTEEIPDVSVSETSLFEIQDAIQGLRSEYKQVIILRYIQDKSINEASSALGWTEAKVRVVTH